MNLSLTSLPARLKTGIILVLLFSLFLSSCAPKQVVQSVEATAAPTATEAPTNTPQPTHTNTPLPTNTATSTKTPKPTATATPDKKATAMAAKTATAIALVEKIKPDLETYGYAPGDGHLAWSSEESYDLTANSYGEVNYHLLDGLDSIGNFIIHTKVDWETTGGLAGCGIIFRAEEDINNGKHHEFLMIRLQNAPIWAIENFQFGRYQYSLAKPAFSSHINDQNGDTNTITLVVKGKNINLYLNGEKERLVEDTKLKEGLIGLIASQESGTTTCMFRDIWVWAIDKK